MLAVLTCFAGGHTAHVHSPDRATRPASDFDLLVPASQAHAAEVALATNGLRCAGRNAVESSWAYPKNGQEPRSLWLVHEDNPWSIDLHSSLNFRASAGAPIVALDSADPFSNPEPWPLDSAAGALRQPLQLLHLAVHASGGLHSLTLLRMVEIVLAIRTDTGNGRLSWDDFLDLAERTNGLGAAHPALAMCNMLAPRIIPDDVLLRSCQSAGNRVRTIVSQLTP